MDDSIVGHIGVDFRAPSFVETTVLFCSSIMSLRNENNEGIKMIQASDVNPQNRSTMRRLRQHETSVKVSLMSSSRSIGLGLRFQHTSCSQEV